MINMSRRGALGLLAATPVAGREVVKRLADVPMVDLGFGPGASAGMQLPVPPIVPPRITASVMRGVGIPDWMRRGWKRRSRQVHSIEPDLDVMRSMSMAAKIAAQRKRNLEHAERYFWENLFALDDRDKAQDWFKKHGHVDFY